MNADLEAEEFHVQIEILVENIEENKKTE
jgi:hypothetical protein